jgi:hypothetical protein
MNDSVQKKAVCAALFASGAWSMVESARLSVPSKVVQSFLFPSVIGFLVAPMIMLFLAELRQTGINRPDAATILGRSFMILAIFSPLAPMMKSANWPVAWRAMLGAGLLVVALVKLRDLMKSRDAEQPGQ